MVGAVAIASWSIILSGGYFLILKKRNVFRVPRLYEIVGLDYVEHGGSDFVISRGKHDVSHLFN